MRKAMFLFLAMIAGASLFAQERPVSDSKQGARKLFLVDHPYTSASAGPGLFGTYSASSSEHHTAPADRAAFYKKCPTAGAWTEDRNAADLILEVHVGGGSTVVNQKGDVLYITPARTFGNIVKDVCKYLESN